MATAPNKVKYNLKNVHYAVHNPPEEGDMPTLGTPVPIKGAVSLSLNAQGNSTPFYADGMVYYMVNSNNGYQGDLQIALIPDTFRKDVLFEVEDTTSKVLSEYNDVQPKNIALLFEFDGDVKAIRHVLYNCKVTRPSITGQTTTETVEPQTDTLSLAATPLPNGLIKSHTTADTTDEAYNAWYENVYMPEERVPAAKA